MEGFLVSIQHVTKIKGIALVEVLITTVITAVGILAIILLLSSLSTSSSISKARDEALSLAQSKIEVFHNNIKQSQYRAITSGEDKPIKGFNGVYSRLWEVIEKQQPNRKIVTVKVRWKEGKNKTESVQLHTIINWNDPLKSASIASYGVDTGFVYLSPNQTASIGDHKQISLPGDADTEALPYQMKKYRDNQSNLLILDANNQLLLTIYAAKDQTTPELLQISGQVYYQGNIQTDLRLMASQTAYCLFPLESKKIASSHWQSAKYYCLLAKGWRGKIGILTNQDNNKLSYCPDRNREYLAYSLNNNKKLYQRGINNSYSNQDFVILATEVVGKISDSLLLSCEQEILQLQKRLETDSFNTLINAENHTQIEMDNVYSLSGSIHFSNHRLINKLVLSVVDQQYDCRVLNLLDHVNDRYSCVIETNNPDGSSWNGKISGFVYNKGSSQPACIFESLFENQHKAAIVDLDLTALCQ